MAIACVTFLAGCGNSANDSKNAPEAKVDRAVAAAPAVEQPESAEEEAAAAESAPEQEEEQPEEKKGLRGFFSRF